MNIKETDKITFDMLRNKVEKWRIDFIDDHNKNYANKSRLDLQVVADKCSGYTQDIDMILKFLEILTDKLSNIHNK